MENVLIKVAPCNYLSSFLGRLNILFSMNYCKYFINLISGKEWSSYTQHSTDKAPFVVDIFI